MKSARLAGILYLIVIVAGFFAEIGARQILLKRGAALGVSPDLLQAQSYMAIQLQGIGYAIALAFFGGTMLTRGYLIVRSTFLPAFIGVLLLLAGPAYILSSFVLFVAPAIAGYAMALLIFPFIGETSLALWLLVKGVNVAKWEEARRAATMSAA